MIVTQFDCVTLKDGTRGTIVDIWEPDSVYEFEPDDHSDLDSGAPLTYTVMHGDIAEVTYRAHSERL